ncbi:MAG: hypothetical protein IKE30_08920 [Clostridia bacterium]|nr:hypothetical protein [Clostridia bacterium]
MAKYLTKREAYRRRAWYRALGGLMDFFTSIASFVVILLCIVLLTTLFQWFRSDIGTTLSSVESVMIESIVNPDQKTE